MEAMLNAEKTTDVFDEDTNEDSTGAMTLDGLNSQHDNAAAGATDANLGQELATQGGTFNYPHKTYISLLAEISAADVMTHRFELLSCGANSTTARTLQDRCNLGIARKPPMGAKWKSAAEGLNTMTAVAPGAPPGGYQRTSTPDTSSGIGGSIPSGRQRFDEGLNDDPAWINVDELINSDIDEALSPVSPSPLVRSHGADVSRSTGHLPVGAGDGLSLDRPINGSVIRCAQYCTVTVSGRGNTMYLSEGAECHISPPPASVGMDQIVVKMVARLPAICPPDPDHGFGSAQSVFVGNGCTIFTGVNCRVFVQGEDNTLVVKQPSTSRYKAILQRVNAD